MWSVEKASLLTLVLFIFAAKHSDGACTFPTDLQNSTWDSSDMGELNFTTDQFTAQHVVEFGSLTFDCVENFETDTVDRYYILSESFTYLSNEFKVALCYNMEKVSSTKYIYYAMTSVLGSTDVSRVFFQLATYSFTSNEVCELSETSISQTRVLVKQGYVNESSVDCHNNISGHYEYNVTGVTCNDTWMDACTDVTEVFFNYTLCSETMAYSAGGQLNCVWDAESDGVYYTLLYNQDNSTDEDTYYKYTCMASRTVDGKTYVTTYPRACLETQNASTIVDPGVSFFMIANNTCPTETTTTTPEAQTQEESVLSAGSYLAIALAIILLLAAITIGMVIYKIKSKRKKQVNPSDDKAPLEDVEDALDGRVSPFFPFPTVSEIALSKFGPSEIVDDDGGMTLGATTPGFTDGRRTMYGKDAERESQASLPVYSEVGGDTPEPTRLSEVQTRLSEVSEMNITDPTPFTMTRATMNIPEEDGVSPLQSPTQESRANDHVQSPRDNDIANGAKKPRKPRKDIRTKSGRHKRNIPEKAPTVTHETSVDNSKHLKETFSVIPNKLYFKDECKLTHVSLMKMNTNEKKEIKERPKLRVRSAFERGRNNNEMSRTDNDCVTSEADNTVVKKRKPAEAESFPQTSKKQPREVSVSVKREKVRQGIKRTMEGASTRLPRSRAMSASGMSNHFVDDLQMPSGSKQILAAAKLTLEERDNPGRVAYGNIQDSKHRQGSKRQIDKGSVKKTRSMSAVWNNERERASLPSEPVQNIKILPRQEPQTAWVDFHSNISQNERRDSTLDGRKLSLSFSDGAWKVDTAED